MSNVTLERGHQFVTKTKPSASASASIIVLSTSTQLLRSLFLCMLFVGLGSSQKIYTEAPWKSFVDYPSELVSTDAVFNVRLLIEHDATDKALKFKTRLKCDGVTFGQSNTWYKGVKDTIVNVTVRAYTNLVPALGHKCTFRSYLTPDGTWDARVALYQSEEVLVVAPKVEAKVVASDCGDHKNACRDWAMLGYCQAPQIAESCPLSCAVCHQLRDPTQDSTTLTTTATSTATTTDSQTTTASTYPVPTRVPTQSTTRDPSLCEDFIESCTIVATPILCVDLSFSGLCLLSCQVCSVSTMVATTSAPTANPMRVPTMAPSQTPTKIIAPTVPPSLLTPETTFAPTLQPTLTPKKKSQSTSSTSATSSSPATSTSTSTSTSTPTLLTSTTEIGATDEGVQIHTSNPHPQTESTTEILLSKSKCTDSPVNWVDIANTSCSVYATSKFCSAKGEAGDDWDLHLTGFPEATRARYFAVAIRACCMCGGGLQYILDADADQKSKEQSRASITILGSAMGLIALLTFGLTVFLVRKRRASKASNSDKTTVLNKTNTVDPNACAVMWDFDILTNDDPESDSWMPKEQFTIDSNGNVQQANAVPRLDYLAIYGEQDISKLAASLPQTQYTETEASESTNGDDFLPLAPVDFVSTRASMSSPPSAS